MGIHDRLAELGLSLPKPPMPLASYVPYKLINLSSAQTMLDRLEHLPLASEMLYISGMIPLQDGAPFRTGRLGAEVSLEDGVSCAQICTLNGLAWANTALKGDLDRIIEVVQVRGYVASTPDFFDHSKVVNGCSDLLVDVFGDDGRHTRVVSGAVALPLNVPVEIDFVFSVR